MTRLAAWMSAHRLATLAIAILGLAVATGGALGVAKATDSPSFCRSACHEMRPFADAWEQGPHAGIACVECHVDPGTARLTHKAEALKEVVAHVRGNVAFPLKDRIPIPNDRCVRCHERVEVDSPGFDHAAHAAGRDCETCHRTAGHEVDPSVLAAAGIYNSDVQRRIGSSRVATIDGGTANVSGHVTEPCSRCHDLAKTGCGKCHEPNHKKAGAARKTAACDTCHAAGERFVFAHPAAGTAPCGTCHEPPATAKHGSYSDRCQGCHTENGVSWKFTHTARASCDDCHARPAKHRSGTCTACHAVGVSWAFRHPKRADCTSCHPRPANHRAGACTRCHAPGPRWSFTHPSPRSTCTGCHARPAGHRAGSCTSCHRTGVSWTFSHPRRGSCASCHARPAGHRPGTCTSCHRSGTWRFSHPGSSSTCTSCHARPSGHRAGSCLTCHRTGSSWAFRHPSSSSCASCHSSPGNHYGSSCASCHTPSKAWSSATFSHPWVPGGEHTYRSFACTNCHPSGYGSYSCAKCHDSASGPREGDDD